ncbi:MULTISPECIES: SRPBCC family protein [unclassified Xanthobacter]|uniref:SRPBCC family protein n=1 Tax=unclassified Xanthobacter TaxID=2623496 RepID=UPI001EDD9BDC|nr:MULTISPECIES: carbon monoxide dehydrogenase subunit G [unclassified Xanthobacter]
MDMSGEQRIPAPRAVVWQALNDPEILKLCIPGCQELVKSSDTQMSAKVVLKVGPVSARFDGAVTFSDLDPPTSYRITGEGQGGMAGFAKGEARVRLEADGEETILHYAVEAQVGGRLAQLGARLIDATAKQMSGAFFKRFAAEIIARMAPAGTSAAAAPLAGAPVGEAPPAPLPPPAAAAAPSPHGGFNTSLAGLCVAAAALAAVAYFLSESVRGGGGGAGVSMDFAAAVILLLTAAVGYLLGRLTSADRAVIVIDRDAVTALLDRTRTRP